MSKMKRESVYNDQEAFSDKYCDRKGESINKQANWLNNILDAPSNKS